MLTIKFENLGRNKVSLEANVREVTEASIYRAIKKSGAIRSSNIFVTYDEETKTGQVSVLFRPVGTFTVFPAERKPRPKKPEAVVLQNLEAVKLDIYTWQGMSIGAIHYYGDLHGKGKTITRIMHPITQRQAERINTELRRTHNREYYELYKVAPGDIGGGFDTEEEVIEYAKEIWLKEFPDADILIDDADRTKVYATKLV